MENYDSLFEAQTQQAEQKKSAEQPFDKGAWVEKKKQDLHEAYQAIDGMSKKVFSDNNALKGYLDFQSHFRTYGTSNVLLILAQKPEATQLAKYDDWAKRGRSVKRRQTGIKILDSEDYPRDDGSTGRYYYVDYVFDISQTYGREITQGQTPKRNMQTLIKALVQGAPIPVKTDNTMAEGVKARYMPDDKTIHIQKGMDGAVIFSLISKEMVQAQLDKGEGKYDRSVNDFKAECVSYILCKRYGISAAEHGLEAIPDAYKEKEPRELKEVLTGIRQTANDISNRMDLNLTAFEKQRSEPQAER
ncbi:MAG: hypothetical protein ACOYU3_01290 [Bacillota bacterium]